MLSDDVIDYLLRHGRRDMPSLLATLAALDRQSLATKRPHHGAASQGLAATGAGMETGGRRQLPQRLTLFDLDNTLIAGDSDYGWAQFLIEAGVVDAEALRAPQRGLLRRLQGRQARHSRLSRVSTAAARGARTFPAPCLARALRRRKDRSHAAA